MVTKKNDRLRRRLFVCLIVLLLAVVPVRVSADETEYPVTEDPENPIVVSYYIQIRRNYSSLAEIPASIQYSEFSQSYNTVMSGTLFLSRTVALSDGSYYGYFQGYLYGNI